MVDIYASSVSKEVFVWISLIVLTISMLWVLIFNISPIHDMVDEHLINNEHSMPQLKVAGYIIEFGGLALSAISLIMLYIYQIYWKPYKHLKGVDDDKLNAFIAEQKKK